MANGENYLSRFFVKFIEISAAGVATAVSGYVLAHLSGYLNSAPPAAIQAPAALQVPAGNPTPVTVAPAPVARPQAAAPAPAASASATPPAAPAAPSAKTAITTAPSAPLRKSLPSDKPADTANAANVSDGKVRDVTDTKPRSPESIEAEVRAALAKVDATRPGKADAKPDAKPDAAPRRADNPPEIAARTPATDTKPRPAEAAPTGAIANAPRPDAPPRSADIAPPRSADIAPAPQPLAQPAQQAPMQIAPPPAVVEIKSAPVAGVDSPPQPEPQADAQARSDNGGFFGAFRRLPERLRDDKPLPPDQAPRPPADVGQ